MVVGDGSFSYHPALRISNDQKTLIVATFE
jgi:hypothetical protein